MRILAILLGALLTVLTACSDPGRSGFEAAAESDRQQNHLEAATKYLEAHQASPNTKYGKLARVRAEVLLMELGARHLQAKQWDDLDSAAGRMLELDSASVTGNIFKGSAAFGRGDIEAAQQALGKAAGEPSVVSPPSPDAVEATALALFQGATAGAESALGSSVVDAEFLVNARTRLENRLATASKSAARRGELAKAGTPESIVSLLDSYPDSPEAAKVRPGYAKTIAAKLQSVESVGPPSIDDPDPVVTLVNALKQRAPDEPASKQAFTKIEALRTSWEERYAEQITEIDEQLDRGQAKTMELISSVIAEKCVPLKERIEKGDEGARPLLAKARQEAAGMIPNGLTEEDLQKVAAVVRAGCTPTGE